MTLCELCLKDVISVKTGKNLGRVDDLCIDQQNSRIAELIICGRTRLFGLLGREEDIRIPWRDVVRIGPDVILVKEEVSETGKDKKVNEISRINL